MVRFKLVLVMVFLVITGSASGRARVTRLEHHVAVYQTLTLVTPVGQPLGGYLQGWVNAMTVAHRHGKLTINPDASACGDWHDGTDICAGIDPVGTIYWGSGKTQNDPRWTLYHEMGHEFDAQYLTDADHARLLPWLERFAGQRITPSPWLNLGAPTHEVESESAGEWFADAYAACADDDQNTIADGHLICGYIGSVGTSDSPRASAVPLASS